MNADIRPVLLIAVLLSLLTPRLALAACTSPEGVEGEVVYNGPYKTVQFCDGSNWVSMSGTLANETDPKVGTLTADLWCTANAAGNAIDCTQAAPTTNAAGTAAGALQFRGIGGGFAADDSNLVWDDTNDRLGVGLAAPLSRLDVAGGVRVGSDSCSAAKAGMLVWSANTLQVCTSTGDMVSIAAAGGLVGAAPLAATYITQTPDASLPNEQALSLLSSGIVKVTTGTGVLSTVASIDLGGSDASGTLAVDRFPALQGDVTTTAGSLVTSIADDAVTFAKLQNLTSGRLLGRATAGTGDPEQISIGNGLSLSGSTLNVSALGADSLGDDELDFDKFKDAMTLDASTNIAVTGANFLSVTNSGTGNSFVVNDEADDMTPLVIDADGNVGIGTIAPQSKLEIQDGTVVYTQSSAQYNGGIYSTGYPNANGSGVRFASTGTTPIITLQSMAGTSDTSNLMQGYTGSTGKWFLTSGGYFRAGDGTAATPALSFANDNNTGFFTPSTNSGAIAFTSNGSEKLRFDSFGNVGIGTTSPGAVLEAVGSVVFDLAATPAAGSKALAFLDANGTNALNAYGASVGFGDVGASNRRRAAIAAKQTGATSTNTGLAFLTYGNATVATDQVFERMIIDHNGNVGIGITTPKGKLEVNGNLVLTSPTVGSVPLYIEDPTSSSTSNRFIGIWNDDGLRIQTRNDLFAFVSNDYIIDTDANGATTHRWMIANTEKFRIASTGNVGIGTSSPGYKLDVTGSIYARSADASMSRIGLTNTNRHWTISNYGTSYGPNGAFAIADETAGVVRMIIDANGNVGIGAPPAATFHVRGSTGGQMNLQSTTTGGWDGYIGFLNASGAKQWNISTFNPDAALYVQDADASHGVRLTQNSTSWASTSDVRLKRNIEALTVLDRLQQYRAVSFDWVATGRRDIGVIAQELYEIFPELVDRGSDIGSVEKMTDPGVWSVRYDKLGALALGAAKELKVANDNLALENTALRIRLDAVERRLEQLTRP